MLKLFAPIIAGLVLLGAFPQQDPGSNGATLPAFTPGEQSTYRIAYFGVAGGTAQVTVGADTQQWGRQVRPIVVIARSDPLLSFYPIRDKFVSFWDVNAQRSVGSVLFADENKKKRFQQVKLDHEAQTASVVKHKEGEEQSEAAYSIPPGSMDMAGAAFALRNQPLEVGRIFELPIFTGQKSFTLRAIVEGREKRRTPMGDKDVFKVRVQTDFSGKFQSKRDMFGFFTADSAHVLVRVEADFLLGTLVAEMTDYQEGRSLDSRATIDVRP